MVCPHRPHPVNLHFVLGKQQDCDFSPKAVVTVSMWHRLGCSAISLGEVSALRLAFELES